jgi:hypothetical protein
MTLTSANTFSLTVREVAQMFLDHAEMLHRLPEFEQHVFLWWLRGESQAEIASRFECSQPTIHYRLGRALLRLEVLSQLPPLNDSEIVSALRDHPPSDIETVRVYYRTSSQTAASSAGASTQGYVRHRLSKVRERLRRQIDAYPNAADTSTRKELLAGLQLLEKRPNTLNDIRQHAAPVRRPVVDDLLQVAEELLLSEEGGTHSSMLRQLWEERNAEPAIDSVEGLIALMDTLDVLRHEGPQTWERLCTTSTFPRMRSLLKEATRSGSLFSSDRGANRKCHLLPPAARSYVQSFQINWALALENLCSRYEKFSMDDAAWHLGLPRSSRLPREDKIIRSILEAREWVMTAHNVWQRRQPSEGVESVLPSLERALRELGVSTARELHAHVNAETRVVSEGLAKLVRAGRVVRHGRGSSTAYVLAE